MLLLKHASKMEAKTCIVISCSQRVGKRVTSETSTFNADDGRNVVCVRIERRLITVLTPLIKRGRRG